MRRHIALLVPLATATTAAAEPQPLDGRQLKEMVAGSSVTIDAPMGYKLPIRHGEDGVLSGDAGGLAFYLGSRTDSGRWRVKGDKLCYKWDRWFSGEERCMTISADGNRIFWVKDDGDTGTGTLVARAEPRPADPALALSKPIEARTAARPPETKVAEARIPAAAAPPPSTRGATSPAARLAPPPLLGATAARSAAKPAPAAPVNAAPVASAPAVAPPKPIVVAAAGQKPNTATSAAKAMRVGGPPPPPEPAFRVVSVEQNDVLNIRIGPSAEHLAVGAIPPDARGVRLVGACVTEWCPVRHRGIVGWVHSYYLAEDPAVR